MDDRLYPSVDENQFNQGVLDASLLVVKLLDTLNMLRGPFSKDKLNKVMEGSPLPRYKPTTGQPGVPGDDRQFDEGVRDSFDLTLTLLKDTGMLADTFSEVELNSFLEEVASGKRHSRTGQPVTSSLGVMSLGSEAGQDMAVAAKVMKGRDPDFITIMG